MFVFVVVVVLCVGLLFLCLECCCVVIVCLCYLPFLFACIVVCCVLFVCVCLLFVLCVFDLCCSIAFHVFVRGLLLLFVFVRCFGFCVFVFLWFCVVLIVRVGMGHISRRSLF